MKLGVALAIISIIDVTTFGGSVYVMMGLVGNFALSGAQLLQVMDEHGARRKGLWHMEQGA